MQLVEVSVDVEWSVLTALAELIVAFRLVVGWVLEKLLERAIAWYGELYS